MINTLRKQLAKGRFARNVATMLAGNITAQAIALLASPIITRLYSPNEFGLMTLVWSYCGIFIVISCLSYEQPIVIEPGDNNAVNIFVLCVATTICISMLFGIVIYFFSEKIIQILNFKFDKNYLWFVPVALLSSGLNKSIISLNVREKKFKLISLCVILGTFSSVFFKIIIAALFFSSGLWLISGNILGLLVPASILLLIFCYKNFLYLKKNISINQILKLAKFYYKFPTFQVATNLLNSISQNLPVALLAYFFSPMVIGYYGLANSIMRRPVTLLSKSLSGVFLQKIAAPQATDNNMRKVFLGATKGLFFIGIIPFAILGIAGSEIFSFVFGEKWLTAGFYAQLLSPWLFLMFINPPSNQVIIVKQKLQFNMFFNIISLLIRMVVIVVTAMIFVEPVISIVCFSVVGVTLNIYYISYAYRLLK